MNQLSIARSGRAGFTLIELLMAVAAPAAILNMPPAVQRVREAANQQSAERNLRQIAAALETSHKQTGKLSFTNRGVSRTAVALRSPRTTPSVYSW